MGKKTSPPKFLQWILSHMLKNEDKSHRLGDFQEVFSDISRRVSKFSATKWYCRQILTGMPKLFWFFLYWRFTMFKNHFKTTFRNLGRNKIFSIINLGGLALGMACGLLILLWVLGELSYDKFHIDKENIYRITQKHKFEGHSAATYLPLAKKLKSDFPGQVKKFVRFLPAKGIFKTDMDNTFKEDNVFYVDEQFTDLFSFPFLNGGKTQALKRPNTVIITERISNKYFGSENPIGKIIKYKNLEITGEVEKSLEVTGILKNSPHNSHIKFDFLISISTFSRLKDFERYGWHWPATYTYVLLQDENTLAHLKSKLPGFKKKHLPRNESQVRDFVFQPITDIHLKSHLKYEIGSNGNIVHVFIFSMVAIFVIFIACFNYVNLSTALAARRAKEVGLKKVLGAKPTDLIFQFMGESFGFTLFAFILALGIVEAVLPFFNNMLDKNMNYLTSILQFPLFLCFQLFILFLISFFAGFYPALFLSKFQPTNILRGKTRFEGGILRKILVTIQFAVSAILISGMVIVYQQMNYIQDKDLGFTRDNMIVVPLWGNKILSKLPVFRNNILQNPNISDFTAYSNIIGANDRIYAYPIKADGIPGGKQVEMSVLVVDYHFIDAFKLQMVEGRGFSDKITADRGSVIINEKAQSLLKWDKPLGKKINVKYINRGKDHIGTVLGVVKDFNIRTLHHEIEPMVIFVNDNNSVDYLISYISFKINSNNISSTLADVKNKWSTIESEKLFEYIFLDERISRQYQGEQTAKTMITIFSFLAILIAYSGLFGLASFMTTARTKEIGIRRVLGASKTGLTFLLSRQFLQWVFTANLVALPIAWFLVRKWLQNFAYRIDVDIWTFVISAGVTLLIAFLTVSTQSLRAASANPVDSIRYE